MDREWTDKRMDDFAKGVDRRFDQVDSRLDRVEGKLDRLIFTAWGGIAVAVVVKLISGGG
jgi:uncharacterized protein YukE